MPYDQLLKDLLQAFFVEFMRRFFPDQAARLDLSQVTFLQQEIVADVGRGHSRVLDLIAQVRTTNGVPELVLIHVELQARPEPDFPLRMFEYYTVLRRRHRTRVLPIVVYITGGRGDAAWEEYREDWFDEWIVAFRYRRLRLRALKAREALHDADPLTAALAVLMDRRGVDPAALKLGSLQTIGQAMLDEARQWLLVNFVETYLPLGPYFAVHESRPLPRHATAAHIGRRAPLLREIPTVPRRGIIGPQKSESANREKRG